MKLLIEKAITSENYNLIIMMINMSKAFDTINGKTLLEKLETILDESEMRVRKSLGEEIPTNIGVALGDCLSALLSIFFLAKFVDAVPYLPTREDFGNKVYGQNSIGS